MDRKNIFFYFAILLLAISLIVFVGNLNKVITGNTIGTVNLTISSLAQINFTTNVIDWGTGAVAPGEINATLDTSINGPTNITNGNWTSSTTGLVIENIGNQNVSLKIDVGLNASEFFGGTNPQYWLNISEPSGDDGSCTFVNISEGEWFDANTSMGGDGVAYTVCDVFGSNTAVDSIRIDVRITIPEDAEQTGSAIGDVITATGTGI